MYRLIVAYVSLVVVAAPRRAAHAFSIDHDLPLSVVPLFVCVSLCLTIRVCVPAVWSRAVNAVAAWDDTHRWRGAERGRKGKERINLKKKEKERAKGGDELS